MKRILLGLLPLLLVLIPAPACDNETGGGPLPTGPIEAGLQQGFWLPIGQEASIAGENLLIRFEEVIEDSRCPLNVECIWAGQASYAVRITSGGTEYRVVLTETGLGGRAEDTLLDYRIAANLEPYPQEPGGIAREDYRLRMSVSKLPQSLFGVDEQAEIYAAVIRRLFTTDHSFGSSRPDFPNLYVICMTDDGTGGDFEAAPDSRILPEELRDAISSGLGDLPTEIRWANSFKAVPLEDSMVEGGGAIVQLGNIREGEDGKLLVAASIYVANLAATGRTYILEKKEGHWSITGDTGQIWIS